MPLHGLPIMSLCNLR
uniref:Uncharacterized protein n=1 Tax=Anguilla anguilla TaxID=7936 RepID=A0A0E9PUD8_ANGAN